MASGDTKTEALLNALGNGGDASAYRGCCNTKAQNYILDAIDRVQAVEDEVERLENNPDVVDIVATYADLEDYDTSELTDKDIIRVLADSNHNDNSTYYRWNASTNQFDFVGEINDGVEYVDLALTSIDTTNLTFNATASKTTAEVRTLINNGKDVYYRLQIAQSVGSILSGTYLMRAFVDVNTVGTPANGIQAAGIGIMGGQPSALTIRHLGSVNGAVMTLATKEYVDTQVGDIETILQTLTTGTGV